MKRFILLALLFVTVSILVAADPVAILLGSKGDVVINRDMKKLSFKKGEPMLNNDEIRTGSESFAAVKYIDGTATLKIFSNSVVKITTTKQEKGLNKNTILDKGSLYSKVTGTKNGSFQIETPTTVASVKGTGFGTNTDGRSTTIVVNEGEVVIKVKETGEETTVGAGQTGTVDEDGNINVGDTTSDEYSNEETDQNEGENQNEEQTPEVLRIQMNDNNGHIKYINIILH